MAVMVDYDTPNQASPNNLLKQQQFHTISIFICLSFFSFLGAAQPVLNAIPDKTAIKTGEPITIKLTATWPGKAGFADGFIWPDSIPHFEIWDQQKPVLVPDGVEQQITITSYDSGTFTIPAFRLSTPQIKAPAPGYATKSITIAVTPVNVDSLKDYHDIKDIIGVPPIPQWPYILAIAAMTLFASIALYLVLKKLGIGKKPTRQDIEAALNPLDYAITALEALEQNLPQNTAKQHFTQLTHIYRTYLSNAYHYRSYQQTGGELILQSKPLLGEVQFFDFANTIRLADAAKFAKYDPPKESWSASIVHIKAVIMYMDKALHST